MSTQSNLYTNQINSIWLQLTVDAWRHVYQYDNKHDMKSNEYPHVKQSLILYVVKFVIPSLIFFPEKNKIKYFGAGEVENL